MIMFQLLFNDNYVSASKTIEIEKPAQYGRPPVSISVKTEQSGPTKRVEVNDTDVSTSCADQVLVEDEDKEDFNNANSIKNLSKTKISFYSISNNCVNKGIKNAASDSFKKCGDVAFNSNSNSPVFENFKPRKVVKESDKM